MEKLDSNTSSLDVTDEEKYVYLMFCGWTINPVCPNLFQKEFGDSVITGVLSYAYKCQKQYDVSGSFFSKVDGKY